MADELARHYHLLGSSASPRRPPSCSAATARWSCSTTPLPASTGAPSAPDAYDATLRDIDRVAGLEVPSSASSRAPGPRRRSSLRPWGPCPDRAERGEDACAACRAGSEGQALARCRRPAALSPLRDREHHHGMLRLSLPDGARRRTGSASSSRRCRAIGHGARRGTAHRAGAPLALQEERSVIARELHDRSLQALSHT